MGDDAKDQVDTDDLEGMENIDAEEAKDRRRRCPGHVEMHLGTSLGPGQTKRAGAAGSQSGARDRALLVRRVWKQAWKREGGRGRGRGRDYVGRRVDEGYCTGPDEAP